MWGMSNPTSTIDLTGFSITDDDLARCREALGDRTIDDDELRVIILDTAALLKLCRGIVSRGRTRAAESRNQS